MSDVLTELLADLDAETLALRAVVADHQDWSVPTPAAGWDVATTIGHLAWTDEVATAAATDPDAWAAIAAAGLAGIDTYIDDQALLLAKLPPAELLVRWDSAHAALRDALASHPAGTRMPWFGPPMSAASMATARLMETWAHGLDVHDALGLTPEPTDRIRHVAHLGVRTRDFAFHTRGLTPPAEEFRVELTGPAGEAWTWGPADATQRVSGAAYDFCRLATQRVHRADTDLVAVGPDADRWLDIAQCFAGEPGAGREARRG